MLHHIRRFVPAVLIALAAASLSTRAGAQASQTGTPRDAAKVAVIREILTMTRAADQAIFAMETSLPAQRAANPNIPAVFWDRFMAQARARKGELEEEIIGVYDRHFSTEELKQLVAFYRTPIGAKMLQVQPSVVQESMMAGQAWGQRIGMDVGQQLAKEGVKVP